MLINPFLTYGYAGAEYFCDRVDETKRLTTLLVNGNHVALMSPRRMGKTGLLNHCFAQKELQNNYYTFIIDIYNTKSLAELTFELGKGILSVLKSKERKAWEKFIQIASSFRTGISLDEFGKPSWNLELGDISAPTSSLDEIFEYLNEADKPCLVAIDEFQSITEYRDKNVEATLRTYIQKCNNARFVFSGSRRKMMGEIFNSPARPFYQSTTGMTLKAIPFEPYSQFIEKHFSATGKAIDSDAIKYIYDSFDGTTWYIQKVANELFPYTEKNKACSVSDVMLAISRITHENEDTYKEILYHLTSKQKALLIAICKEGTCNQITSSKFIKTYKLNSASSVQKALEALLDKELVTNTLGVYSLYDYFFSYWLKMNA